MKLTRCPGQQAARGRESAVVALEASTGAPRKTTGELNKDVLLRFIKLLKVLHIDHIIRV